MIIYGAVLVLSILMAAGDHPDVPLKTAVVLFGLIMAITLAKLLLNSWRMLLTAASG